MFGSEYDFVAETWTISPEGTEGWVDLSGYLHSKMIYVSVQRPIQVETIW